MRDLEKRRTSNANYRQNHREELAAKERKRYHERRQFELISQLHKLATLFKDRNN